jgi:hypothetical protein
MLNTALSDDGRFPLKVKDLVVMDLHPDKAPGEIIWMPDEKKKIEVSGYTVTPQLYSPFSVSTDMFDYEMRYMYIDTAGGGANGDETVAWAIYFLHGYTFAMEMLPLPGGYSEEVFQELAEFALKHKVNEIGCEMNHGYGSFAQMLRPVLHKVFTDAGHPGSPLIDDDWVSQQKELRIIDTLDPLMAQHRLILNRAVLDVDRETVKKYPLDKRSVYTLIHQMQKITRERGCLIHDDRLDGLAGGIRRYMENMAVNAAIKTASKQSNENIAMMSKWSKDFENTMNTNTNMLSGIGRVGGRKRR